MTPAELNLRAERVYQKYLNFMFLYLDKSSTLRHSDHQFLRDIEEEIDVSEQGADDFRRMIGAYIGQTVHMGNTASWTNAQPTLKHGILSYLFGEGYDKVLYKKPSLYRKIDDPWEPEW